MIPCFFWAQNSDIRTLDQIAGKELTKSEGKMKIKDSKKYSSISVFDLEMLICGLLPFFCLLLAERERVSYSTGIVACLL